MDCVVTACFDRFIDEAYLANGESSGLVNRVDEGTGVAEREPDRSWVDCEGRQVECVHWAPSTSAAVAATKIFEKLEKVRPGLMTLVATMLLRLAVALLPATQQARFLDEWRAEIAAIHSESNALDGIRYAAQLVVAAPRMTLEIRSDSESAYAELSIGVLISLFPSAVLVGLAVHTRVWIMVVAQLAIIVGGVLAASGFWSFEDRLLDSRRSRFGVSLAVAGGVAEIAIRHLTGFGPPINVVVNANIAHAVMMAGLFFLVGSSYAGRFRSRMQLLGVGLLAPGAAINVVATIVNGFALSGFDRFAVLMYTIPSAALAWACYSIVGRRQVFEGPAVLEL